MYLHNIFQYWKKLERGYSKKNKSKKAEKFLIKVIKCKKKKRGRVHR